MSIAKELLKKELKEAKDILTWLNKRLKEKRDVIEIEERATSAMRDRVAQIEWELEEKK